MAYRPEAFGQAGCMGDIGTHALHLAEYISGLRCTEMCADLTTFLPGRELEDDGAALLRFDNGARGVLMASQVAVGDENALKIRIYGEKGGIEWRQEEPNTLLVKRTDRPTEIVRVGNGYMGAAAKANTRTPRRPPRGLYRGLRQHLPQLRTHCHGQARRPRARSLVARLPGVDDGIRGMQFIETVVRSGYEQNVKWIKWIE